MLIPVVLGGYVNGYGIIRGLGEKGIDSILIERKGIKSAATASKYVKKTYYFSDPELEKNAFLKEMIHLGKQIAPDKGILYPTHDEYVITLWKNKKILSSYFEFPMSEWDKVNRMINKKELYKLCEEVGIDYPKTKEIKSYEEYKIQIEEFRFPIIIKPSVWDTELIRALGKKVVIFYDKKEADIYIKRVYVNLNRDGFLLVQEFIEGKIENMPDVTVFCDKNGKVKCWAAAIKKRQFPPQTGTATMTTILAPSLPTCQNTYELTKKLVEKIGFYGVCDAEYMYDTRDNSYKMMEVNTRFHMQNYMICASGVNMAYYVYCEHQGKSYKYHSVPTRLVAWCKPIEDKYNAIRYNKKNYKEFGMTRKEWKATIPKDTIGIIDNKKDCKVFIRYAVETYKKILSYNIRATFRIPDNMSIKEFVFRYR